MSEEWVQIQVSTLQAGLDRVAALEATIAAKDAEIAQLRAALQNCVDYWPSALNDDLQERTLEDARSALARPDEQPDGAPGAEGCNGQDHDIHEK